MVPEMRRFTDEISGMARAVGAFSNPLPPRHYFADYAQLAGGIGILASDVAQPVIQTKRIITHPFLPAKTIELNLAVL